jgi:hypothetical protein
MRGIVASGLSTVMRGLDPRIDRFSKKDGLPGQARQ